MANRSNRYTPLSQPEVVYSDFLINFNPHPVSKEVVRSVNERAVAIAMRNLLQTNRGERLYQPDIGANIKALLFDQLTPDTGETIAQLTADTLRVFEPRAKIVDVLATPDEDNNAFTLTITFYIINKNEPFTFNITLTRAR